MPIFLREMTAAARQGRLQSSRAWFAGILLAIMLGTFAAWYYADQRLSSAYLISAVSGQSFLFVVIAHATALFGLASLAALSIAGEIDRKTLGFLLATQLSSTRSSWASSRPAWRGSRRLWLPVCQ